MELMLMVVYEAIYSTFTGMELALELLFLLLQLIANIFNSALTVILPTLIAQEMLNVLMLELMEILVLKFQILVELFLLDGLDLLPTTLLGLSLPSLIVLAQHQLLLITPISTVTLLQLKGASSILDTMSLGLEHVTLM